MHKSKPPHDSFASYFNYLEQIQDKKLNTLEPIKKKIVDLVFMNTKNGVFWTVTQYANEKSLGSLITIHRNIHELIAEDYLVIAFLNGKRLELRHHVVSALTLIACHEFDSNTKSYMDIADAIRRYGITQLIKKDQEELFARMIFNIFVSNDDDHLRNHAFLWNSQRKGWGLSPLYDVMPHAVVSTERYQHLAVGPQGKLATLDNAFAAKERFGISSEQAQVIIDRIWRVVRQWQLHFENLGIDPNQIEKISKAFRHIDDICSPDLAKQLA